jgi:hypothetical protein
MSMMKTFDSHGLALHWEVRQPSKEFQMNGLLVSDVTITGNASGESRVDR